MSKANPALVSRVVLALAQMVKRTMLAPGAMVISPAKVQWLAMEVLLVHAHKQEDLGLLTM